LDKTFPTNDCSMCIISPKLVECGRHLNIQIHTLSEVKSIAGAPGNFTVSVEKDALHRSQQMHRLRDLYRVCPVRVSDEFNLGLSEGKAVYRSIPGHSRHLRHQESDRARASGLSGQSQRQATCSSSRAQVSRGPALIMDRLPLRAPSAASVPIPVRPTAAARKWMSPSPSAT